MILYKIVLKEIYGSFSRHEEIIKSGISTYQAVDCCNNILSKITDHFPQAVVEQLDRGIYRRIIKSFYFGVGISITFDDTQHAKFILYVEEDIQYGL